VGGLAILELLAFKYITKILTCWVLGVWQSYEEWKHYWKGDQIDQYFCQTSTFGKAHVNLERKNIIKEALYLVCVQL